MLSRFNRLVGISPIRQFSRASPALFNSTLHTYNAAPVAAPSASSISPDAATFESVKLESSIKETKPAFANKAVKSKKTEETVVFWKLYASFPRHNTICSLVAVVEDPNFLENNPTLTHNEKVLYYLRLPHHVKLHVSAGQLGFRKSQRQDYEAAFQVAGRLFKLIEERNLIGPNDKIELIMKDYGKGKEAFLNALQGKEGVRIKEHIVRVSDNTPLKFGGSRSKKLRRL